MKWVAKISDHLGELHDYELSPRFDNVYDCQKYIDENLKEIEVHLSKAFKRIKWGNTYDKKGNKVFAIVIGGSFIRPYNLTQDRWVSSFDY